MSQEGVVEIPISIKLKKDGSKVGPLSVTAVKEDFKSPPIPDRGPAAWIREPIHLKIVRTVKNKAQFSAWKAKQLIEK